MAFATAIILVQTRKVLANLVPSHGVLQGVGNTLADTVATIKKSGTFIDFNDVVCNFDGVSYIAGTKRFIKKLPSSSSVGLFGKNISLKEILSRLPGLGDIYFITFNERPKNKNILLFVDSNESNAQIQIWDQDIACTQDHLSRLVNNLRESYPFLQKWCLISASVHYERTVLDFKNLEKNIVNDLSESFLIKQGESDFTANQSTLNSMDKFNFIESLQPLTGALLKGNQHASESFEGEYISEFSLYYLGAFILSSVARYRPNMWMSAITHSVIANEAGGDAMLAILEKFMDIAIDHIPKMVVSAFGVKR
jgi:hypothetical protein